MKFVMKCIQFSRNKFVHNKNVDIKRRVFKITFIKYAQSQQIGKSNN